MRNILQEIQDNLNAIEKEYSVRVLLAVESGSRAWGFASPDSDYDVRFIYVRRATDYLRIDPLRDVIEWKLDEVLDINGWDLKKVLAAAAKGNPNILEWAGSPVVYRQVEDWLPVREAIIQYFSEKTALCHYYGTANNTWSSYLTGKQIRYKKYFYTLRPLLCCIWIERNHTIPPVRFEELLTMFGEPDEVLTKELREAIWDLLERKKVTEEKDLNPQIPVIQSFIENECERQKQLADEAKDDHQHSFSVLNDCFREVLNFQEQLTTG